MQLLLIHADYMEYETKERTRAAEDIEEEEKKFRMEGVLTVFVAVERTDDESVARKAAAEIKELANKVGTNRVMLYPYAHLSADLASPGSAIAILKQTEDSLSDIEVHRAPFGWYKSFQIHCKGHPLSESSRSIKPEKTSEAIKSEEKMRSEWYILDLNGELIPVSDFDFERYPNLKKFADYEIYGTRAVEKEPPHVKLMRAHGIADYEPGSDAGNLRWYPKGTLIKRLLEEHVSNIVAENGGMEVETPIMYDLSHPELAKYLDRFPARQYGLKSGEKEFFLRFSACFGQYLMKHDMTISHRNLPLRLYELAGSFRREQRGELVGLRRLRAFTMPDMHTLVKDIERAKEEFVRQYKLCMEWMEDLGLDYEVGIRFVRSFYDENKVFSRELVGMSSKPALIEMWDERHFYFIMKHEFNVIDALEKASALSTVQIDIENPERFDIHYVDEDGSIRHPLMLHASISGGIDRNVYALLEKAYIDMADGKPPMFPIWLSPTQIRLIPVADRHIKYAEKIKSELGYRVDIDDRDETVSRKVMDAGREWIPYVAVIGDEEIKGDFLTVTIRKESGIKKTNKVKMKVSELKEKVEGETKGMPFRPLPLPVRLSKRPVFCK